MQKSTQKTSKTKGKGKTDSFVWSDDEVELRPVAVERQVVRSKIRLIAALFMLICGPVHWTLTLTSSSYSKTFVLDRPHEYDKFPFLKICSLESVFKNLRICGQKRLLRVDGRCKRRKN